MTISELKKDAKVKLAGNYKKAIAISLLYYFIVILLNSIPQFINITIVNIIYLILVAIISIPLSFGMISSIIKIVRNEDVKTSDFINIGLSNIKGVWRTYLRTMIKLILPIIIIVAAYLFLIVTVVQTVFVTGMGGEVTSELSTRFSISIAVVFVALIFFMIKSLSYSLTMYILHDKPTATGKEINEESALLMKGNKWKIFLLGLSFIGWFFLILFITCLVSIFVNEIAGVVISYVGSIALTPYIYASLICFYEDLKSNKKDDIEQQDQI